MKRLLLALFVATLMASQVYAQSTLALQEKCSEGAKKFFVESEKTSRFASSNKELGVWNDEQGWGTTEFIAHYNKRLDKCFILIKSNYHHTWESRAKKIQAKREDRSDLVTQGVFDVFEGREVGVYDVITSWDFQNKSLTCYVGNRKCKSMEDFQELIKAYMEE